MPENPYHPSHQPIEPKPRSRYLEITAIVSATLPTALWLFLFILPSVYTIHTDELEVFLKAFVMVVLAIILAILIIWIASGIYNLRGALKGRFTGYWSGCSSCGTYERTTNG
jgi:hypothetical protein